MTLPFAALPKPPYYLVAFSSLRRAGDDGYAAMAEEMMTLALAQPGCLGAESARGPDGFGITNSYFADEASMIAWKADARHLLAQKRARLVGTSIMKSAWPASSAPMAARTGAERPRPS